MPIFDHQDFYYWLLPQAFLLQNTEKDPYLYLNNKLIKFQNLNFDPPHHLLFF